MGKEPEQDETSRFFWPVSMGVFSAIVLVSVVIVVTIAVDRLQ